MIYFCTCKTANDYVSNLRLQGAVAHISNSTRQLIWWTSTGGRHAAVKKLDREYPS